MPQFPATGPGVGVDVGAGVGVDAESEAVQVAEVPPLEPPQLHVHGPEPVTDDDVPAEQRLAAGADDAVVPFADPHVPLVAAAAAFTVTVALAGADVPPLPLQLNMYVVVLAGDTVRVPLVALVPDQPPEAAHEVALVEDQVTVETLPGVMLAGLAENDTVGDNGVCAGGGVEEVPPAG
jgi:hypothetical protein